MDELKIIRQALVRLKKSGETHVHLNKSSQKFIKKLSENSYLNTLNDGIKCASEKNNANKHNYFIPNASKNEKISAIINSFKIETGLNEVISGVGSLDSKIVFVLDYPSLQTNADHPLLNCESARMMGKIHEAMGINLNETYITSVFKSKSLIKHGSPKSSDELRLSKELFNKELDIISPSVLILLGISTHNIIYNDSIEMPLFEKLNDKFLKFNNIDTLSTYHPSYLILNENIRLKRRFWEVILKAMHKTSINITNKQRNFFKLDR